MKNLEGICLKYANINITNCIVSKEQVNCINCRTTPELCGYMKSELLTSYRPNPIEGTIICGAGTVGRWAWAVSSAA